MTASSLRTFSVSELQTHPWQKNIPNIDGKEWKAFVADIRERGVKELIRVSLRTGAPVIVDGHQRLRAGIEIGYQSLEAITESFADEGEEITFLAGAARFRRHLSDYQRVQIGQAYESYFRPKAKEAQQAGGGDKKSEKARESVTANLPQAIERAPTTDAQTAETVGMSERQYRKGKAVSKQASEPVIEAWREGGISTHAAHELTNAPDPIQRAISDRSILPDDGSLVLRDKELAKEVAEGRKTVSEAVSIAKQAKEARQAQKRDLDYDIYHKVLDALEAITALELSEYHRAAHSGESAKYNVNAIQIGIEDAIAHLHKAAEAIRVINTDAEVANDQNTITV